VGVSSHRISPLWRLVVKKGKCLIHLGGEEQLPKFYCVHSIGGEITSLYPLARMLGTNSFGIQVPKENMTTEFAASIPAIAAHYVDVMTQFQPEGPFMLGGWSVGAVIALEMARQLVAHGREVSLLAVLDGFLYNTQADTNWWSPIYYVKLLSNLPRWIADDLIGEWNARLLLQRLFRRLGSAGRSIVVAFTNTVPVPLVEGPGTAGWSKEQIDFARALYAAAQNYVPQPYDGAVLVYAAKTRPLFPLVDIRPGWKKIAPRAKFFVAEGTHVTMFHPTRISSLANHLREQLEKPANARVAASPGRLPAFRSPTRAGRPLAAASPRNDRIQPADSALAESAVWQSQSER
jgi:thioesterase domain-containing protein